MEAQISSYSSPLASPAKRAQAIAPKRDWYQETREKFRNSGILSKRMAQLADLMGQGLSNKQCAERMDLAVSSIKTMAHVVYERSGIRGGRPEFMEYWRGKKFASWKRRYAESIPPEAMAELLTLFAGGKPE